jgi:putative PIN family toxin of toxin-antitoxin system
MPKVMLDTTVLISALLKAVPGGASHDLLRFADDGVFELFVSEEILEETSGVLLRQGRIRQRYGYSDEDVIEYCRELTRFATVVSDAPQVRGVVPRDPDDDMIIACALAAGADYIVTRDKDLLSLRKHENISIITPEAFLQVLRKS